MSEKLGPLGGVAFIAVLDVASIVFLSRIEPPLGIEGITQLVGALGLVAGSFVGWVTRKQLRGFSLARAAVAAFIISTVAAIGCFVLPMVAIGLVAAVAYVVLAGILCFFAGALCAIAGVALSKPDA